MSVDGTADRLPVSMVIPVRNEAATLPALWRSIQSQTLAPDEIVIVDGGSGDGTVDIARRMAAEDGRIKVVESGVSTPGRSRNIGISQARHDWLALTDSGIVLDPGWLEELIAVVRNDPRVRVVYGHYEPLTRTWFERCAALAYVGPTTDRPGGRMRGPSIASALVHRSAWSEVGGFPDLRATEDLVFMAEIDQREIPTGWAPTAVAYWELRPTFLSTFGRFRTYSAQAVMAGRHHWHRAVARNYLVAVPFCVLAVRRHWTWLAVPAAEATARVARSIWQRREDRKLVWALNPVQFLGVAVIILTIDVATFVGWLEAVARRATEGRRGAKELHAARH